MSSLSDLNILLRKCNFVQAYAKNLPSVAYSNHKYAEVIRTNFLKYLFINSQTGENFMN